MAQSRHQQLGGVMTPEECKSLVDFCAEHEANQPRYEQAKAKLDAAWELHQRLEREAKEKSS